MTTPSSHCNDLHHDNLSRVCVARIHQICFMLTAPVLRHHSRVCIRVCQIIDMETGGSTFEPALAADTPARARPFSWGSRKTLDVRPLCRAQMFLQDGHLSSGMDRSAQFKRACAGLRQAVSQPKALPHAPTLHRDHQFRLTRFCPGAGSHFDRQLL